jgi:hypothetical protein
MAGLFAAAILREECKLVIEAQSELPNNHSALLRFRSSVVGDALNIPFKPVQVIKAVASLGNPVADAIGYSIKTNGNATLRSIITAKGELERRFIAPPDFISRMAGKVTADINFGERLNLSARSEVPIISTIPMPALMQILGYENAPKFEYIPGYTCTIDLHNTDVCATVYIPDQTKKAYRASITGSRLIIEYAFPGKSAVQASEEMKHLTDYPSAAKSELLGILSLFGMCDKKYLKLAPEFRPQQYAKIMPIDDNERKRFMLWATEKFNVYSFGRFATWRTTLLMDDLVQDLRVIQRLANGESKYNAVK